MYISVHTYRHKQATTGLFLVPLFILCYIYHHVDAFIYHIYHRDCNLPLISATVPRSNSALIFNLTRCQSSNSIFHRPSLTFNHPTDSSTFRAIQLESIPVIAGSAANIHSFTQYGINILAKITLQRC